MTDRQLPKEEVIAPLCTEIYIKVSKVHGAKRDGFDVLVHREVTFNGEKIHSALLMKAFDDPNAKGRKHEANSYASGMGKIFGVMDVRLA